MRYRFGYLTTATVLTNLSMFLHLKQTAAFLSLGAILLLNTPLTVQAKPKQNSSTSVSTHFYQKAKQELPSNMYALYRVIERIARANGLDERPWRVAIVPQYQINAFASEVNLVAVYTGILDQLAGDSSALACVVAHEMGHHVLIHQPIRSLEQANQVLQAQRKTEQTKQTSLARAIGDIELTDARFARANLRTYNPNSAFGESALTRAFFSTDPVAIAQRIAAANRFQEYEADVAGYILAATAGFEPEGCIRAMNVLSRLPGGEQDTTSHPAAPKRIEALKNLMAKYPPQHLKRQGEAILNIPLSYDRSEDGVSLRINSRRGGSTPADLERLLGQ